MPVTRPSRRRLLAPLFAGVAVGGLLGLTAARPGLCLGGWPDGADLAAATISAPGPAGPAVPAAASSWWLPPLAGRLVVARPFSPPATAYGPGHRGVDLAAPAGAMVTAAGAGTVVYAGMLAGRVVVSIGHAGGLRTTYEPLDALSVRRGQRVTAGTPLGRIAAGHPGCPAAACLHWGLLTDGPPAGYLDPLLLLGRGPPRLLPLDPAAVTHLLAK